MNPVRIFLTVITSLAVLVLAACAGQPGSPLLPTPGGETPVSSTDPTPEPPAPQPTQGEIITGENAQVESVQVLIMESFPLQASANIHGHLPDGCTEIDRTEAVREGNTFTIRIFTKRPAEAICTLALVPFELNVPLDIHGLPAGTYTVEAYGQQTTFTLEMDNILPTETACPQPGEDTRLYTEQAPHVGIGYCFLYPADFDVQPPAVPGMITISGPDYGEGPEPVEAFVTINTIDPAGKGLQAYVDEQIATNAEGLEVVQETVQLGAQTEAILVEGLPGRTGNRVVFAEHNSIIYVLTFAPLDDAFPEATADMERLYESMLNSWTYLQ